MLNFKFIHRFTSAVVNISADSTEVAWRELDDLVLQKTEWYVDDDSEEEDYCIQSEVPIYKGVAERTLPDSEEAPIAWADGVMEYISKDDATIWD